MIEIARTEDEIRKLCPDGAAHKHSLDVLEKLAYGTEDIRFHLWIFF
jgi:hypothetical protein